MQQADGSSQGAASPELLLRRALGWSVPVQSLRHWVLGLPGRAAAYRLDGYGRLQSLELGGWLVSYDDYVSLAGEQGAKDAGRWRLEGRDYVMQEGDVVHFRFNV